jgi:hypothetical protein
VPQLGKLATKLSVSPSASLVVNVYVLVSPSFAVDGALLNATVGALFAIVTVFDRSVPTRPGASVGVASTVTTSPLLGLIVAGGLAPVQLLTPAV